MAECLLLKGGSPFDEDAVNAVPADVLTGKKFMGSGSDEAQTGNMPNIAADVVSSNTFISNNRLYYDFQKGAYLRNISGAGGRVSESYATVANRIGLTADKIKSGQTVLGIAGTASKNLSATAATILKDRTAMVNGAVVTGTIPSQGGSTTTPGTANKTIVTAGKYVTGNVVVAGSGNLKPEYIKKGVNIFGVVGTWSGYVATATDLYLRGNNRIGFSASTVGAFTFESGQISIRQNGFLNFGNINFTGYTKLFIEGNFIGKQTYQQPSEMSTSIERPIIPPLQPSTDSKLILTISKNGEIYARINQTVNTSGVQTFSYDITNLQMNINNESNIHALNITGSTIYRIWLA